VAYNRINLPNSSCSMALSGVQEMALIPIAFPHFQLKKKKGSGMMGLSTRFGRRACRRTFLKRVSGIGADVKAGEVSGKPHSPVGRIE